VPASHPSHQVSPRAEDARELHAIVILLETLAVRTSPPPCPAAIDALRQANGRLAVAPERVAVAAAEAEVHALLTEPCDDDRIVGLLDDARRGLARVARPRRFERLDVARAIREHAAIIDALAVGDRERAAERLRSHHLRRRPETAV
jgi:DNA-binding GntR family transcriptional regulator